MDSSTQAASPQVLKKLEKELAKEGKAEEARLQHAVGDLSATEKVQGKVQKAVMKAESNVSKMGKKETAANEAMHKAAQKHDVATTHLQGAEKAAERQQDIKLQQELDAKKANVEASVKEKTTNIQGREATLAKLRNGGPAVGTDTGAGVDRSEGEHTGRRGDTGTEGRSLRGRGRAGAPEFVGARDPEFKAGQPGYGTDDLGCGQQTRRVTGIGSGRDPNSKRRSSAGDGQRGGSGSGIGGPMSGT
ncbi:hypothetical protein FPV67DRAFT_392289 [Lyophyllum atratum]|nr:hypothetical protein FPV67DRAFT_392289 [Lyophyllum atratum]